MRQYQAMSIGGVVLLGSAVALAQTTVAMPAKLVGSYTYRYAKSGKTAVIPVELSEMIAEGDTVRGRVTVYRSPAGNCISDNTPFSGVYKDAVLRIKSEPLKSQFADGRACGAIIIEAKVEGAHASGTLTAGSEVSPLEFDIK